MAEIFTMFPIIGSIAVICYLLCEAIKLTGINKSWIPIIAGVLGGVLAIVGTVIGMPGLVGITIFDAVATGILSGFAASGLYDTVQKVINKQ